MMKKKKSKGILKRIILYGGLIATVNQTIPACSGCISQNSYSPPAIVYNQEKYTKLPKEWKALEYLVLANALMAKGGGEDFACVGSSKATINIYHKLIKRNNRLALKNKVRLMYGKVNGKKGNYRHAWIQYKDRKNKITNFEATSKFNMASILKINKYVQKTKRDFAILPDEGKQVTKELVSDWGGTFIYPAKDLLLYPGGLIGMILED